MVGLVNRLIPLGTGPFAGFVRNRDKLHECLAQWTSVPRLTERHLKCPANRLPLAGEGVEGITKRPLCPQTFPPCLAQCSHVARPSIRSEEHTSELQSP